jgi:uncharacterized protein (TIGR04255 family)
MTIRTGVLKHSPLSYALASIRFAPWPLMSKKIDEIQNDLREIAPLLNRIQLEQVGADGQVTKGLGVAPDSWTLLASDKSYGFLLSQDQLLFMTNRYVTYDDFEAKISHAMEVLFKYMVFMDVLNVGVRYVDRITPRDGEGIAQYISPKFLPPVLDGYETNAGHVFSQYAVGGCNLRVNAVRIPNALPIPQDLLGVIVMMNGAEKPLNFEVLKPEEMLLDMDAIYTSSATTRMKKADLEALLRKLHSTANGFFRREDVLTDFAFEAWR